MKRAQTKRTGRTGFTLVEVLVVIAIIAVLVGLLTAAVAKARTKINEVRNRNDISQLAIALETFKSKYKDYPPSRIRLEESSAMYQLNQTALDLDSTQFINKMFQRIAATWANAGIDWNGDGVITPPRKGAPPVILEGDQCLVFFLGGIPANTGGPPACTGFSTNPQNPAAHVKGGGDVNPPLFEFQTGRLVRQVGARLSPFFSYLDAYGSSDGNGASIGESKPFAYFSSYKSQNGYNRYVDPKLPLSDCQTLGIWPYAEVMSPPSATTPLAPRYVKPNSFQIISAGANRRFGPGTVIAKLPPNVNLPPGIFLGGPSWTPNTAGNVYPDVAQNPLHIGHDDQSNFYESFLGVEAR